MMQNLIGKKSRASQACLRQEAVRLAPAEAVQLARSTWYDPWKASFEFVAALLMLIVAAPLIVLSALFVKLSSRGPAFYTQTRMGRDGKPYTIYKLRSMAHDCEKDSGPCWSRAGDSRVTPLGRFLRRTHLDELPQLWNVLRGDMSLVGPRPERPEFIPHLEEAIPLYRDRLLVRPGVTGLAQVQLPPDSNLASVRRKLAFDLYYVQHAGPWLDFRIVIGTCLHMFGVSDEIFTRFLGLPRGHRIEDAYEELVAEVLAVAPQSMELPRELVPMPCT